MAAIHADRISLPGQEFVQLLDRITPADPLSAHAKEELARWNGSMEEDSVAALIYTAFRERLIRDIMGPLLGPLAQEAFQGEPRGGIAHMARLKSRLTKMIREDDRMLLPAGKDWPTMLSHALASAVEGLRKKLGEDIQSWQWGKLHHTKPQHPLSATFPEMASLLDPPGVSMGGDGETVQQGGFTVEGEDYSMSSMSVTRYVFDLGDWNRSGWVVPLGASGHPGSPHYTDQVQTWQAIQLYPMLYEWSQIVKSAESHQTLQPK
jgi:penicillin amidase